MARQTEKLEKPELSEVMLSYIAGLFDITG